MHTQEYLKMLTLEEIAQRLKQRNFTVVSEETGISYLTISNIAKGLNKRPHKSTLRLLNIYFEENP